MNKNQKQNQNIQNNQGNLLGYFKQIKFHIHLSHFTNIFIKNIIPLILERKFNIINNYFNIYNCINIFFEDIQIFEIKLITKNNKELFFISENMSNILKIIYLIKNFIFKTIDYNLDHEKIEKSYKKFEKKFNYIDK
ncbi:MAG: hypothetical protein ACTSVV_08100, partial [Promethearchaeota archaeon]